MTDDPAASRTQPTRDPDRVSRTDWPAVSALIAEVRLGHVGLTDGAGRPVVLPIAVAVAGAGLLLHGSTGSRWLRQLATGGDIAVAVTADDGLIVARSAFESSIRYRSAVLFGRCERLTGAAHAEALDVLTAALLPGRVAEVRRPTSKELDATLVLRMTVHEYSYKYSDGWSDDPVSDVESAVWAGVVPIVRRHLEPLPAPDLAPGIAVPASVRRLVENSG